LDNDSPFWAIWPNDFTARLRQNVEILDPLRLRDAESPVRVVKRVGTAAVPQEERGSIGTLVFCDVVGTEGAPAGIPRPTGDGQL